MLLSRRMSCKIGMSMIPFVKNYFYFYIYMYINAQEMSEEMVVQMLVVVISG